MAYQELGCFVELAALQTESYFLDVAELLDGLLEQARETPAVESKRGECAMGINDVKVDGGLLGGWMGSAGEQVGFEERDAVEAPGGVDEFLDELGFGGIGGVIFVEELAAVGFEGGAVL